MFSNGSHGLYTIAVNVLYHYGGTLCTGEATMVTKNDISGDPKRDAFMDEGEFAEQAFEVQVTSKVAILQCQIMLNKIIW